MRQGDGMRARNPQADANTNANANANAGPDPGGSIRP
jgi:hypothetical protein